MPRKKINKKTIRQINAKIPIHESFTASIKLGEFVFSEFPLFFTLLSADFQI